MVKIRVLKSNDTWMIEASGHAEYGEDGKDIVCAALSALIGAFDFAMHRYHANGFSSSGTTGAGEYLAQYIGSRSRETNGMIRMLEVGIALLAQEYPENVEALHGTL